MAIQSVGFEGHKKHKQQKSSSNDVLNVALKGGFGAVAGYVAGKYVLPMSDEFAEKVMMSNLVDSFIENQPKPKRKPNVNKDDVKKQPKITTPKAKTNMYAKLKQLVLSKYSATKEQIDKALENKQLQKLHNSFEQYSKAFFEKNGGKELCVSDIRNTLKSRVGRKIALFTGGIFTFAAIIDQAFKAKHNLD